MAREPPVPADDESPVNAPLDRRRTTNTLLLGRRSYLKLAGVATVGVAAASRSVVASDYDVIEVPTGTHERITVGSGETLENVLIDCSVSDTAATITASGSDWTVRNVGFLGEHDLRNDPPCFAVTAEVDAGSVGRLENVYLGDGSSVGEDDCGVHGGKNWGRSALWTTNNHAGTVEISRCNFSHWPSNAIYASGSGPEGGPVTIDSCYFEGNGVNNLRLGTRGSAARDCVFVHDVTGVPGGRGIWAWYRSDPSDIVLENCHFTWETPGNVTASANGGTATLRDCHFQGDEPIGEFTVRNPGSDPRTDVPDGCPTSAAEAASGSKDTGAGDGSERGEGGGGGRGESDGDGRDQSDGDDDGANLPRTIIFRGAESGVTRYGFTVDGEVRPSNDADATVDDTTEIDGGVVSGVVANWRDAFRFDGELTRLTVDGPATVFVDGNAVDPDDVD